MLKHSADCGTKYRGCAPDCPKQLQETIDGLLIGLDKAILEQDYCWVCGNHAGSHSKDCAYALAHGMTIRAF